MSKTIHDGGMDEPLFADEDGTDETTTTSTEPWNVLVVDDDADVIAVTRLIFASFRYEGRPIRIIPAFSAAQARTVLEQEQNISVAYIDVVMESDHAGLDLVRYIRDELGNNDIQLILRTGQPGFAPEMKVILEYGINDYRIKTEVDNVKLITSLVAGLRNYQNIMQAQESARQQAVTESVSQSKSLFFAQISHDFRTPLNSILGFCELLGFTSLSEAQKENVQLISASGHYLLQLVNDILEFSKGEAGKIQLDIGEFALVDMIRDTFKQLHPQVKEGVAFQLKLADNLPTLVRGDAFRLRQVLHNLLSNALKFTRQGRVELAASLLETTAEGWRIKIDVSDTGIGIAEENINKLFSPYQQAEHSVSKEFGGTGLGLMICKQLVGLMGGEILLESIPEQGSKFSISLPLAPPLKASGKKSRESTVVEFDTKRIRFEGANVMIVDDDATTRLLLTRILQNLGVIVTEAATAEDALQLAAEQSFDLVLTDCGLPDLDGFELTRQLRDMPAHGETPVVALSGADPAQVQDSMKSSGMNDFVQKPVRLPVVMNMLTRWLKRSEPSS